METLQSSNKQERCGIGRVYLAAPLRRYADTVDTVKGADHEKKIRPSSNSSVVGRDPCCIRADNNANHPNDPALDERAGYDDDPQHDAASSDNDATSSDNDDTKPLNVIG